MRQLERKIRDKTKSDPPHEYWAKKDVVVRVSTGNCHIMIAKTAIKTALWFIAPVALEFGMCEGREETSREPDFSSKWRILPVAIGFKMRFLQ